ncbi:MAG: metalloregulator ArsR/SmtB family transcription factor [Candidatus Dormiibacterota bacterium]
MVKYRETEVSLNSVFSALADPIRRAILERLGRGDATISELAEPFGISLPAISRHLKVLEHAGLITHARPAQWRTSRLHTAPLDDADAWIAHLRRLWTARLDRLDVHLQQMKGGVAPRSISKRSQEESHHGG